MKKTKRILAVFLAAVLLVGTGMNNNLLTVNAETGEKAEVTVSENDVTTPTDGETLTDAQQAFIDAVDTLDKAAILELVNAYKENANEETEAAFYAEYDKVEDFDTSAYELYQALSKDEKSGVADSYATLMDIMDSVATILDSKVSDKASTYLNADTVATVGTTEYTASTFVEAIAASSESNPVEVVNDFSLPDIQNNSLVGDYYINLNNHTISCEGYFRISLSTMHLKGNGIISVPNDKYIYFKDLIMENITVRGDNIGILCDSLFMNNCSNVEGYIDIYLPKAQKDSKISGNNTIKKISINTSGLTSENKLIIEEGAILNVTDKITCMLVIENNGTVNVKSIVGRDQAHFINNDTLNCEEVNIAGDREETVALSMNNTGKMTINKIVGAGRGDMLMPGVESSLNIINSQDLFLEFTDTSSTWDSVTINNAGTTYLNGNASSASSHITNTGSGKVMKLINAIAVTGVATPVAGTAFDHRASTDNEDVYSASADYYIGDTKVTDTNAGFNKTYTVKVTVTPGDGYGFLEAPVSALLNNSLTTPVLNEDGTVTLTYAFSDATAKAKLTGITTPTAITGVSNGTAKDAASLGLPSTVTIATEDGNKTANVTWNVAGSSYDVSSKSAQTFNVTGTIAVPDDIDQDSQSLNTTISVTVNADDSVAPTITTHPANATVIEGDTATFTVAATGTPAPTYQWQINKGATWEDINDAKSASYTTSETVKANSGYKYRCVVTNRKGSVTSNEATLTVTDKPVTTYTITVASDDNGTAFANITTAASGTKVTLTATPKEGYQFKEWQVISGGVTITSNVFTMPSSNVSVKAIFEKKASGDDSNKPTGPSIVGDNGTTGWDAIKDKTTGATAGSTITVDMNGTTKVPGAVIDSIKGKDVNVVFDLGNGIKWTINGQSVTKDGIGEIDFGVTTGTTTIPVDVVNEVTGERYSIQISLAYNGEFGFTATLSINMDAKNAGYYANLYYYNKSTGKLEFMNAGKIDEEGNVELTFTHASDYTIVVSDKAMNETETSTPETPSTTPTETDSPKTGDNSPILLWVLVLLGSGIGVTAVASKKRKRETK